MNADLWTREIMSLKVPNVSQKDVTKILILLYFIEYKKINTVVGIKDLSKFVFEFYIDNPNISKFNPNSVIRNIGKYDTEDIIQIIRIALFDWKNDYSEGCMSFNENEIYVKVDNIDDKVYSTSMMIAKMLYKKATMEEWNYSPELKELDNITTYDLDYLNTTRLKNRVLEDMDYCCCCDKTGELFIVNILSAQEEIKNPYNYVTVCKDHYNLFKDHYFNFSTTGQVIIKRMHPLLNEKMHISQRIMKNRKKEVD